MKSKRAYLFLTLALILTVLASCRRSLAPGEEPTDGSQSSPQPGVTQTVNVDDQLYIFATQTAFAAQGLPTSQPGAETTPILPLPTLDATLPTDAQPTAAAPLPTQPAAPVQPTTPVVLATAPPLVVPDTYSLQTGEFPFCIARRFNVDPGALLRVNGLNSYSVYYAGMSLRIPKGSGNFPGGRALMNHPTSYSVRGGDTIHTIACAFGDVDPNAIAVVNNLTPPYRLSAGQVLQIP